MKINVSIELEIKDPLVINGAPPASADRMVDMLRIHTSMVAENFYGRILKFDVVEQLDTTP